MKIQLDDDRLNLYTQAHKSEIGEDVFACAAGIISGSSILIPSISDIIESSSLNFGNAILVIVGILPIIYGIYKVAKWLKYRYNAEKLYKDVKDMNEIKHPFSLVAIKDTFNKYPNRFLLHYEKDWDCDLFFSFHTLDNEEDNITNIIEKISHLLQIDPQLIHIKFVDEAIQTKFSERDKQKKVYDHRLYTADIDVFPEFEKAPSFELEGVLYKWASIAEMKKDERIRAVNMDVVDFVSARIS